MINPPAPLKYSFGIFRAVIPNPNATREGRYLSLGRVFLTLITFLVGSNSLLGRVNGKKGKPPVGVVGAKGQANLV